jgi:hypothetical protein
MSVFKYHAFIYFLRPPPWRTEHWHTLALSLTYTDNDTDKETDNDTDTGNETDTDTDTGAETDIDTGTETDTDTDINTDVDTVIHGCE